MFVVLHTQCPVEGSISGVHTVGTLRNMRDAYFTVPGDLVIDCDDSADVCQNNEKWPLGLGCRLRVAAVCHDPPFGVDDEEALFFNR